MTLGERLSFLYGYSYYGIPLLNFFEDIHSLYELTKDRVFTIKVGLRCIGNEELAAIGIGPCISH